MHWCRKPGHGASSKAAAPIRCVFDYVLRKHEISVGDTVVSSGLDGVFPKGLRVGRISEIVRQNAGIFQKVSVTPYVDFEILEEVFILSEPASHCDSTGIMIYAYHLIVCLFLIVCQTTLLAGRQSDRAVRPAGTLCGLFGRLPAAT
jgi:hypothetical protein